MSLVTRCTSCGTVFRVVQDQLKVSAGWVRCGRCGEVFNALQTLFDLERDQREPPLPPPGPQPMPSPPTVAQPRAPEPLEHDPAPTPGWAASGGVGDSGFGRARGELDIDVSTLIGRGKEADVVSSRLAAAADPAEARPSASRLDASPPGEVDFPISILPEDQRVNDGKPGSSVWPEGGHSRWIEPDAESDTDGDGRDSRLGLSASRQLVPSGSSTFSETPEFLRDEHQQQTWNTPLARGLLSFVALALGVMMLGQMAVHERDRAADRWPSLRPLLAQWCRVTGCELLEAPRRLEAFTVESTSLTKAQGLAEAYRLTITVRNRAKGPATLPSVELALSDADGQLVARRVLHPADFRIQRPVVPAGGETTMQLVFSSSKGRVNGYTVDLFYP